MYKNILPNKAAVVQNEPLREFFAPSFTVIWTALPSNKEEWNGRPAKALKALLLQWKKKNCLIYWRPQVKISVH